MLCSNAYVVSDEFLDYPGADRGSHRHGDEDGTGPLYRLYPARAGWVFLAAPLDREWDEFTAALAAVTGDAGIGRDPRFGSAEARASNASELAAELEALFAGRTAAQWEAELGSRGVACVEVSAGPFSDFTINDATMTANGFTAEVDHPRFGRHRRHGPIVTLSDTPGRAGPACLVGQHTRSILTELGYTTAEMDDLRQRGIVAWPEPDPATGGSDS
jgi:crotonobetainyl-CoA:carnitine CoA-transferase CaiB-like acyl-CoA transferase